MFQIDKKYIFRTFARHTTVLDDSRPKTIVQDSVNGQTGKKDEKHHVVSVAFAFLCSDSKSVAERGKMSKKKYMVISFSVGSLYTSYKTNVLFHRVNVKFIYFFPSLILHHHQNL
jgi:hypothetical protein